MTSIFFFLVMKLPKIVHLFLQDHRIKLENRIVKDAEKKMIEGHVKRVK